MRGLRPWPAVVVLVAAVVAAVATLGLLAGASAGAPLTAGSRAGGFARGRVVLDHGIVDAVSPTADGLDVALEQGTSGRDTLERLAQPSGRVLARRDLGASLDASLSFGGVLWVLSTSVTRGPVTSALWRLDPRTLAVRSRQTLTGFRAASVGPGQALAVAGGKLWLAYGDRLVHVDPATGKLGGGVTIARARVLGITAGLGGRTLVLSAGDGRGRGWIQERNAATGAFEASSGNYGGVLLPVLGGVSGDRLWISEATGMMGYAQAVSLRTLRPLRTPALPRETTNGIEVRVAGGVLFVTDGGVPQANYCGDPATGAARLPLPPAVGDGGYLFTVRSGRIYYRGRSTTRDPSGPLLSAPVPAACR